MRRTSLISAVVCVLCLGMGIRANAAYEFYVTIDGTKTKFAGEGKGTHANAMVGVGFEYEIKGPRDLATGQASGKRQHGAITITKEWGAASPQLMDALSTNEVLKKVTFEFYKTSERGALEPYYTITLTNATVSNFRMHSGAASLQGAPAKRSELDTFELENVSFTFQKITIEHKVGKTMFADDWHK